MKSKVLIILPTYNESGFIGKQLIALNKLRENLREQYDITILNVDDSSPDGTAEKAIGLKLSNFSQIINPRKIGFGPGYLIGFNWGLSRDFV